MVRIAGQALLKPLWQWVLFLGSVLVILFMPIRVGADDTGNMIFHVRAGRFAFWPAIRKVNPGDRVTIKLSFNGLLTGLSWSSSLALRLPVTEAPSTKTLAKAVPLVTFCVLFTLVMLWLLVG